MNKLLGVAITVIFGLLAFTAMAEQATESEPEARPPQKAVTTKAGAQNAKAPRPAKARQQPAKAPTPAEQATADTESADEEESDDTGVAALPTTTAEFVAAMSAEIREVEGRPVCDETAGRCFYHFRGDEGRVHEIQLWFGETSRTIYVFVNHFASAPQNADASTVVLRHLAALNRVLEIARFEWNPADGEVRLSTVMNVDTNFDRFALRGLLRLIQSAAERYAPMIAELTEDYEDADQPPSPTTRNRTVSDRHNYMDAIQSELDAMGYSANCDEDHGRCTFELDSEEARNVFPISVQYNSQANTVIVSTDRFVTAPTDNPRTDRLLQRALELNWQNLTPMFQWDASSGTLRVAGVVNTDSNLDRRALRGVIQSVNHVAEQHYREFRGLLNP